MEKVVHLSEIFKTIFLFNFFEPGMVKQSKFEGNLKSFWSRLNLGSVQTEFEPRRPALCHPGLCVSTPPLPYLSSLRSPAPHR
jgi:hypothetical protein